MGTKQPHVLIIDDDKGINRVLSQILSDDFSVIATTSGKDGIEMAKELSPFLAMVDLRMPETDGLHVLREIKKSKPEISVIMMSAYGEVASVVEAFREGAADFLTKPFDFRCLLENVRKLATQSNIEEDESQHQHAKDIIGNSRIMKHVWNLIKRFSPTDIPILLQGETGTGKELFAKVIHSLSVRSNGPFVPVDCSAIPESLIESELFGYEKGAFTGASTRKEGLFESANMGTLFLDEIGNLPLSIQAKLLRVVQDHRIMRLGAKGYEPIPLNLRVVAATNIDLKEASDKGSFRLDLFYRISVAAITLPPLRERHGDIPVLAKHFLEKCNIEFHRDIRITDEAMNILGRYQWPGNIRELENVIKSAFLITNDFIRPNHLNKIIAEDENPSTDVNDIISYDDLTDIKNLKNHAVHEAEREAILRIMKEHPFINKLQLAKLLKVDPKTLRSKLKKYGFDNPN